MARNDLTADTLTIIRNALMVKKRNVDVPYSKMVESILKILKEHRYINDFKLIEYAAHKKSPNKLKSFKVYLRYISGEPAITNLKRISRPGLRIYVNKDEIPRALRGFGMVIVSTSSGILTDEQARSKKIGGELVCSVW